MAIPTGLSPGVSAVVDALTSEEADYLRAGAQFIEPLGIPTLPDAGSGSPWDKLKGLFKSSEDVPVYHMIRGHETGTDLTRYLNPGEIPAQQRLDKILAPGGGFGTYVEPGGKIFFSPDKSRVLDMVPEAGQYGELAVNPEKYLFEGTLSGNQIARGLSPVEDIEGLLTTSQADEVFGTGRPSGGRGVQQTTTGKVVPANKFLGFDVSSLLGNTSRSAANLGKNTVADIIATPSLAADLGEHRRLGLAKLLGGAARFLGPASIPFDLAAGAEHLKESELATDPLSKGISTVKSALAFSSANPYIGALPFAAELGLTAVERAILGDYIRNEEDMPGSTYDPALGGMSPVPDIPGIREGLPPVLEGIFPEGDPTSLDPEREATFTKAFLKPEEFGLDPFTDKEVAEARINFQELMKGTKEQFVPTASRHILREDIAQAAEKAGETTEAGALPWSALLGALYGEETGTTPHLGGVVWKKDSEGIWRGTAPERFQDYPGDTPEERVQEQRDALALQRVMTGYVPDEPLAQVFRGDTGVGTDIPSTPEEAMTSNVSNALIDAAYGRDVQPELQAITKLVELDPSFNFEKYLDPTSQETMDITSQVESFSEPTVEWTPPKKKEVKKVKKGPTKEEKAATRAANQAANKKLLAEKKEARDIQKAKNAAIRAEKLAAKESAKQASERKAAEKALAIQRVHEKMAREEELKRFEKQLRNAAEESRAAYLARKKQEDELREAQGYGWGDMFT